MLYATGAIEEIQQLEAKLTSVNLLVQPSGLASIKPINPLQRGNTSFLNSYGNKAAKNDDADIPVELWNSYLFVKHFPNMQYDPTIHGPALEVLRNKLS